MPQAAKAARTGKANGPAQGPVADHGETAADAPPVATECAVLPSAAETVLAVGLGVVREQLRQNLQLQQAMMTVISSYCLTPSGDERPPGAQAIPPDLLVALQKDDLLRQRQEGIERALAVLQRVMAEMGQPLPVADPLRRRQRWIDALLESQLLEEMRSDFAAAFAPQP